MEIPGKTFIVTGGGNGIGRHVVLELLRRGARVAAVDVRSDALEETARLAEAPSRIATYVLDITDQGEVDVLPEQVVADLGAIDGLINVAGIIQPFVKVVDLDLDVMRRVIDVNMWGTINVIKATLPHLLDRPEAHVVNVSSMGGFLPVPGQAVYGASKASVKLLSEALWAELIDTRVGVTVVMPGAVGTDITANSGVSMPGSGTAAEAPDLPLTSPGDAARSIVDGIERNRLHVYVGRDARIMGLLVRLAPKQAARLIQRRMKQLTGE